MSPTEGHESIGHKIKTLFTSSEHEGPRSAHAEGFPDSEIRDRVDEARKTHESAEEQADRFIAEREAEEKAEGPTAFVPPKVTNPRGDLSTVAHRGPLKGSAEPQVAMPDMEGVTHIPESQLHERSDRMEHTATRPPDVNDPNSMDGKPEPSSAGDDLAI